MLLMNHRILGLVPYSLLLSLAGCAATQLQPGAERVLVTHAAAPRGCRFVATVIGEQGGSLAGAFTSNRHLAEGAVNDMKNKARDMGANYVVLETTTAGNTISGDKNNISGHQTDVTHMGNAFVCPNDPAASETSVGQLSR
jgi:uncharacterized protein YbjQ (UPF0145 family)